MMDPFAPPLLPCPWLSTFTFPSLSLSLSATQTMDHPIGNAQLQIQADIVIIGGGVAGLATALALHRIGLESVVLERAECLRTEGAAFILWLNAWKALDALGISQSLRTHYLLLDGIRGRSNCTGVQKDVQLKKEGQGGASLKLESRCVERMALLQVLAEALPQRTIRFNSKVVSIHKNKSSPFTTLQLADGTSMAAKIVIGADGVHSAVANWMGLAPARSSGRVALRGMGIYPETHSLEKLMVQIWAKGLRAGFIPCTDKQVYWFITRRSHPQDAKISGDGERLRSTALEMVSDLPDPIAEIIKLSPGETFNLAEMKMRWMWPWEKVRAKGSVTVVGDALHPTTPDLGQGSCLALEDAVLLARYLGEAMLSVNMAEWENEAEKKVESCFNKYLQKRKWRMCSVIAGAFMIGNIQEGCSQLMRFIRDRIFFPLLSMSYILYFADYDCGTLPGAKDKLVEGSFLCSGDIGKFY